VVARGTGFLPRSLVLLPLRLATRKGKKEKKKKGERKKKEKKG